MPTRATPGTDAGPPRAWPRYEAILARYRLAGDFCLGNAPTMADVCLVPQVYNARRFGCPLDDYPLMLAIAGRCARLEHFLRAFPDTQPDAPAP